MKEENNIQNKKRIFFICSHLENSDGIKIELPKNNNTFQLSEKLSILKFEEGNKRFKVNVFSLSFNDSNIDNEVEINLNSPKVGIFSGKILFNPNKNNFIYDFSFDILHKEKEDINPPENINLSYNDKFCLFKEMLDNKYKNINNELIDSLIDDSIDLLKNDIEYYYIDFYLSLLCNIYINKKIIDLLSLFDLKKIKLVQKVGTETISPILDLMRGSPELITKYFQGDNPEKEKHLEAFYTLLLYYRLYYEQDKINELLEDKNANHYYQKILFNSQIYFDRICLNNSFIDELFKNNFEMNYDNFIQILNYLKSLETILVFINRHSELICELLGKQKNEEENKIREDKEENENNENNIKDKKINLLEIVKMKLDDNIINISKEIDILLEKEEIFEYIELGEEFWKVYSEIFNKKNLEALLEIKKILENIKKKRNYLIEDLGFIHKFIHETGIEASLNGKFNNNIEILDFIKNKDIYYSSKKYISFRDINIFAGLRFSMEENEKNEFIKIWKTIN